MKPIFYPVIDNGMGLSVTRWALSMLTAVKGPRVMVQISGPYCGYNMDLATRHFLESECDEMVVIDTDLVFAPQHLQWLMEHRGEPLVFGLYPKRQVALAFPIVVLPERPAPFDDPGPLVEVACAPRGFMRVNRSVFEKMMPHVEKCENGEYGVFHRFWKLGADGTSEDFSFCKLWRELGGRVLVDKRVLVQHAGQVMYPVWDGQR